MQHLQQETPRASIGATATHLVVYPLVHFLLIIQHHEGLGGDGVAVEDEAEVTTLALHVREVDQRSVQPIKNTGGRVSRTMTQTFLKKWEQDPDVMYSLIY